MIKGGVTMKDIAREAGVSTALVSLALNNATDVTGKRKFKVSQGTEERIRAIADKYNYKPDSIAKSLRIRKTRAIGVILSDISNPFFSLFARYLENVAASKSYSVIYASTDENAASLETMADIMISRGVDGLVVVPCDDSESVLAYIRSRNLPIVLFDRDVEGADANRVILDNKLGSELSVKNLYDGGFRNIEMVSYKGRMSNIVEREIGYENAMRALGLRNINIHRADYSTIEEDVHSIIASIDFTHVDSLFFATNSLAVVGVKEMMRMGIRIPEQVGIVVFDGGNSFDLFPISITYVAQPLKEFADEVMRIMINHIENPDIENETVVLSPILKEGQSSVKI